MEVLMGKSSINGPFSMAMLNNQRVVPADFPEKKPRSENVPVHTMFTPMQVVFFAHHTGV
jgi:hypothetical protein